MANKKILIVLFLLIATGFVFIALIFSRKILPPATPTVSVPDETVQEPTTVPLTLTTGATLDMPKPWSAKPLHPEKQYQTFEIRSADNEIPLTEVHIDEWLKGPNADEGYVISHEKRGQALKVLQDIYAHGQITESDRTAFDALAGEFLGYSDKYRSAVSYIASNDNAWRGMTFYNLIGQDIGVSPVYYAVLFNPNANTVLFANYYLPQATPEVTAANAKLRAIDWTKNQNEKLLNQLDLEARDRFKATVEKMPRKELSFGSALDELDAFMKTVKAQQ